MAISKQMIGNVQRLAKYFAVLALLIGICAEAHAGESPIAFHGYGQLICGSTLSSTHNLLSVSNLQYDGDINCGSESLVGAQLDIKANDHITFTAQGLDRPKDRSAPNHPELVIAALAFDYGDDWPTLHVGRQKVPWYMYSPNLEVGESYVWIRPPMSVYFETPDYYDGVSLSKNLLFGNWVFKPLVGYGWFHTDYYGIPANGDPPYRVDYSANRAYGLTFDLSYSSILRFRAAYLPSVISITSQSTDNLFNLLNELHHSATVDQLAVDNRPAMFKELGMQFTPGHWDVEAEYLQSKVENSYMGKAEDYYVSAGYRFGRFIPALTYGHTEKAPSMYALTTLRPNAYCPNPDGRWVRGQCAEYVEGLLDGQLSKNHFYDLSLRYDVTPHIALKLDMMVFDSGLSGAEKRPSSNLLSSGVTFYF
jgi:hypothetical protein